MFAKLSFSLGAALMLCAGVARAAPAAAGPDIYAAESENPDSIDYRDRTAPRRSPSTEEIEAAESGNPDSVGYQHPMTVPVHGISQADSPAVE